jgi:ABC-type nitrate/sulfonate/bicarbonate transport system permease component
MRGRSNIALAIAGFGLVLIAWESAGRMLGDMLLSPPSTVLPLLISLMAEGRALRELADSMAQMLLGFVLACLIGMPLGVMMGRVRVVDALVHPWVSMLVVTSIAALVPIVILLLGTGLACAWRSCSSAR